jgi:hypothetical protein
MALIMEAARTSEMLVNFHQTTWCCNLEDSHFWRILVYMDIFVYIY